MANKIHGIELVGGSTIEKLRVEELAVDPAPTQRSRTWFNTTERALKFTRETAPGVLENVAFAVVGSNGLVTDQSGNTLSGDVEVRTDDPTGVPSKLGLLVLNSTDKRLFYSSGPTADDWVELVTDGDLASMASAIIATQNELLVTSQRFLNHETDLEAHGDLFVKNQDGRSPVFLNTANDELVSAGNTLPVATITVTSADPVGAPTKAGVFVLNATDGRLFFSKGTTNEEDWVDIVIDRDLAAMTTALVSIQSSVVTLFNNYNQLSDSVDAKFAEKPVLGESIRRWLTDLTGTVNQRDQLETALVATALAGTPLVIDVPVLVDATSGNREIFMPDNAEMVFVGDGKILGRWSTTTLFFVLHTRLRVKDLNLEYVGPGIDASVNYATVPGNVDGFDAFARVKTRMQSVHGNVFTSPGDAVWSGPHSYMTAFHLAGEADVVFEGEARFYVSPTAPANLFIPYCIIGRGQWRPNFTVTTNDGGTTLSPNIRLPKFKADSLHFDGTIMAVQGEFDTFEVSRTRSYRHTDHMSATGGNIGGVSTNFPPPHLFYLNNRMRHVSILDTIDYGIWVTTNLDPRARRSTSSGNCCSLKLNARTGEVRGYQSFRPDGLADLLGDTHGYGKCDYVLSDFYAEFDSTVIGSVFPGIRFPSPPYIGTTLRNGKIVDLAAQSTRETIGGNTSIANRDIVIENVEAEVQDFIGSNWQGAYFGGNGHKIDIRYVFRNHTQTQTFRGVVGYQGVAGSNVSNTWHRAQVVGWRSFYNDVMALRNRIVMNGGSGAAGLNGNYAEVIDVNNGHTTTQVNGMRRDRWIQKVNVSAPSGASVSPTMKIPANWTVVECYAKTKVALGATNGTTGYRVGWSGTLNGLGTVTGITTAGQFINSTPIAASAVERLIVVTADGGNFDGTGLIEIVLVCEISTVGD